MKNICFRLALLVVLLAAAAFSMPAPAHADEMCVGHTPVSIDIRPESEENRVNLASQGLLPVVILSTSEFDASQLELQQAHLLDAAEAQGCAGAAAVRWSLEDVNSDGLVDLGVFFRIQDLDFAASTTEAMLMAHGMYHGEEIHIMGMDTVQVIP